MPPSHVRNGFGAVRPYVYGFTDLLAFVENVFNAEVLEKLENRGGFHIEARIGDSAIILELADPPPTSGAPGSIYVYVPDVDATYARALANGATAISPPGDKPYEERAAGVRDRYGNTWWISTYTGTP